MNELAWLSTALRTDVVRRALRTALLVGTVLVLINHVDALLAGTLGWERLAKIALTYCVPYCVSTHASVAALRGSVS